MELMLIIYYVQSKIRVHDVKKEPASHKTLIRRKNKSKIPKIQDK